MSDLTWNTFRRHLILEYEIPKYDGDMGSPNWFVPLSQKFASARSSTSAKCFKTQQVKGWLTEDTFLAIMRLRGVECQAADKYAEAFYCRKLTLGTEGIESSKAAANLCRGSAVNVTNSSHEPSVESGVEKDER